MEAKAIREMSADELDDELRRASEELFRLKFRSAYEELENPALLRTLRRDIARLKTIRRERELQAAGEGDE
ncbi:MAG: 50S ribosomal protein L29 [Gemmatimonadota bacterium]